MKKFLFCILSLIIFQMQALADTDWEELYNTSKPFESKLMHGIDPFQDEDNIKYSYTPYPLMRISTYLYYKSFTIDPGYYQLTPRKMNDKYYVFFKTNGKVKFIIPVVKRDVVSSAFYKKYMPDPKLTLGQSTAKNWKNFWGKVFKDSGKQPPPASFVELVSLDTFYILKLYYKEHCYYTVYKRIPY